MAVNRGYNPFKDFIHHIYKYYADGTAGTGHFAKQTLEERFIEANKSNEDLVFWRTKGYGYNDEPFYKLYVHPNVSDFDLIQWKIETKTKHKFTDEELVKLHRLFDTLDLVHSGIQHIRQIEPEQGYVDPVF